MSQLERLQYHLVFATKYRYRMLSVSVAADLRTYILDNAERWKINVDSLAIEEDHVHMLFSCSSGIKLNSLIQKIKGGSSKKLRAKHKWLKRYWALWTPSHYISTVGNVCEATIQHYLDKQGIETPEKVVRTYRYDILQSKNKIERLEQYVRGIQNSDPSLAPAACIQNANRVTENDIPLRNDLCKVVQNNNRLARVWLRIPGGKTCGKPIWLGLKGRSLPENFELCDSYIRKIGDKFVVYITVSVTLDVPNPHTRILSIDLGLVNPITSVVYCNSLQSIRILGKELKRYLWLRDRRQVNIQKYAKDWKRFTAKYTRQINDRIHKICNQIVAYAKKRHLTIVIGDIAGISKKFRKGKCSKDTRKKSRIPYYRIRQMLLYKSLLSKVPCMLGNEAYTSQRCSRCGTVNKSNRKKRNYSCDCGYRQNADINGAINIAKLWLCEHKTMAYSLGSCDTPALTSNVLAHTGSPRL